MLSLIRAGHLPILYLIEPTPTVLDTLKLHICFQLETLFEQFFGHQYVLPEGLSIEHIGEQIYGGINNLEALQEIFVDLLSQGVQSPHFATALEVIVNFVT